jgi:flagellar biosynthetic protein FliQ
MTIDSVTSIMFESTMLMLLLSAPAVLLGLAIGFMISLFQALTQIQEQTLTFVPKLVVVMIIVALTFPWMTSQMIEFSLKLWSGIPALAF